MNQVYLLCHKTFTHKHISDIIHLYCYKPGLRLTGDKYVYGIIIT